MGRVSDAKERLMEAVAELMWESSYGAVTIDAICDRAKVKKGSFYYFFESKSDLTAEALKGAWASSKAKCDTIFSPTVPPLDRLKHYFEAVYQSQADIQKQCGRVLGCPLFTLGCEVCTQDAQLLEAINWVLQQYTKYFESAIRDAHAQGLIVAPDAAAKAKLLFAYFQGMLTQARIQNNVELLKELPTGAMELLGVVQQANASRKQG